MRASSCARPPTASQLGKGKGPRRQSSAHVSAACSVKPKTDPWQSCVASLFLWLPQTWRCQRPDHSPPHKIQLQLRAALQTAANDPKAGRRFKLTQILVLHV